MSAGRSEIQIYNKVISSIINTCSLNTKTNSEKLTFKYSSLCCSVRVSLISLAFKEYKN